MSLFEAEVSAYDPEGVEEAKTKVKDVKFAPNPYAALKDADALIVCTEWDVFREPDFEKMKELTAVFVRQDKAYLERMTQAISQLSKFNEEVSRRWYRSKYDQKENLNKIDKLENLTKNILACLEQLKGKTEDINMIIDFENIVWLNGFNQR